MSIHFQPREPVGFRETAKRLLADLPTLAKSMFVMNLAGLLLVLMVVIWFLAPARTSWLLASTILAVLTFEGMALTALRPWTFVREKRPDHDHLERIETSIKDLEGRISNALSRLAGSTPKSGRAQNEQGTGAAPFGDDDGVQARPAPSSYPIPDAHPDQAGDSFPRGRDGPPYPEVAQPAYGGASHEILGSQVGSQPPYADQGAYGTSFPQDYQGASAQPVYPAPHAHGGHWMEAQQPTPVAPPQIADDMIHDALLAAYKYLRSQRYSITVESLRSVIDQEYRNLLGLMEASRSDDDRWRIVNPAVHSQRVDGIIARRIEAGGPHFSGENAWLIPCRSDAAPCSQEYQRQSGTALPPGAKIRDIEQLATLKRDGAVKGVYRLTHHGIWHIHAR